MTAISYEDLSHDVKKAQPAKGELSAFEGGNQILQTDQVYYLLGGGSVAILIGDKDQQHVALCFPVGLQIGKPWDFNYKKDIVTLPDHLRWSVKVSGQYHFVEDGELKVTLNSRNHAVGNYQVTLENGGGTVYGTFDMENT